MWISAIYPLFPTAPKVKNLISIYTTGIPNFYR
jgi:hypothetical protein